MLTKLDADETDAVTLLGERATEHDGVRPLSEHVSLHLRHGGDEGVRHLLAYGDGRGALPHLAGYAHLDVTDEVAGSSAEVVVDPGLAPTRASVGCWWTPCAPRRPTAACGSGRTERATPRPAWPASLGFRKIRELLQLRRSLSAPTAGGVTSRTASRSAPSSPARTTRPGWR